MNTLHELQVGIDSVNVASTHLVNDPEECTMILDQNTTKSLSLLSLNIRSINKNFDELQIYLKRLAFDLDILVLTECWLGTNSSTPNLTGYTAHSTSKIINQNSGVMVYIRNNLRNVKVLEPNLEEANCLVVTIGADHVFICLYRPPSFRNSKIFCDSLNKLIDGVKQIPNACIVGDINIDIKIDNNMDNNYHDYMLMLSSNGFLAGHNHPTRKSNCLDHCMLKIMTLAKIIILPATITDHCSLILDLNLKSKHQTSLSSTIRKTNNKGICTDLSNINFDETLDYQDVNLATEDLMSTISQIVVKHTTNQRIPQSKRIFKPWITPGLINCMRRRDKLHSRFRKNPENDEFRTAYLNYRNFCNKILKRLKMCHQQKLLDSVANNIKKLGT